MVLKSGGGITIFSIKNAECPRCRSMEFVYVAFPPGLILFDKRVERGDLIYEIHNWDGGELCCFCSDCSREWPADYVETEVT